MRRAAAWFLIGALAVACALPDVNIVDSLRTEGGSNGASAGDTTEAGDGGGLVSAGGVASGGTTVGPGGSAEAGTPSSPLPGCGDATRTPDEACDDGNLLECGTCSADCRKAAPLAPARGSFGIGADAVLDGETFLLDDGFGAVLFEFDDDDDPRSGGQVIAFSRPLDVQAVRDAIVATVNAAPGLGITAEAGDAGTVLLTNDHLGSVGNRPITDLVSSSTFTHIGMSGGAGYDCPNDTGCFNDDSCASKHCERGACAP